MQQIPSTDAPAPPLHHSFVKIKRARHHIAELEAVFAKYLIETPPQSSAQLVVSPEGGWSINLEFSNVALPDDAGTIFGDAIHNMRTALDLAACECVRSNDKSDKGVYFPFCEKSDGLDKAIKDRHITRAQPDVVKYIRSLKPYQSGNAALRELHDLDVQDKHHGMMPQPTSFASPVIQMLDDNDKPLPIPVIIGDPNKPSDIKIIFPEGSPFAGEEIIPTLYKLVALADSIVSTLASILVAQNVAA